MSFFLKKKHVFTYEKLFFAKFAAIFLLYLAFLQKNPENDIFDQHLVSSTQTQVEIYNSPENFSFQKIKLPPSLWLLVS